MPEGADLPERLCDAADRAFQQPVSASPCGRLRWTAARDLPQRLLDPVRLHRKTAAAGVTRWALGVAGWMRYTRGVDEQGNAIDVVDPMLAEFQKINAQYQGANRREKAAGPERYFFCR